MRNPSSRSSSVRPLAAALMLSAALVASEAAVPPAHAAPGSAATAHGASAEHPGVARRVVRPSGGRYDINTGNGFYGAYQFVPSTWRGLGYARMPHQAPPHVQDEAAQMLRARSGWGQWPACTRMLGLR
jgi:hypothetical protein